MKKVTSLLLALIMVLGMIPGAAAAGTSLTVGDKVLYGKYSGEAVEDGKLTEDAWQTNVTLGGVKFGVIWDSENLYLGFTGTAAPTAITVNGVSVTGAGTASADAREIRIPLSKVGLSMNDFDPTTKLSITLGGAQWTGTLVFDSVEGTAIDKFPASNAGTNAQATYNSGTKTLRFTGAVDTGTVLVRYHGFGDDKSASNNPTLAEPFKMIDPAKPPVAFEFDVCIKKLPVFKQAYTTLWQKETCPGLYFVVGGKSANKEGAFANSDSAGMTFGITNMEEGLVLTVRATDFIDGISYANSAQPPKTFVLGKTLGQQFHLRLNYDAAKDTIDIFVDDTYVGHIDNAEFDNPFLMTSATPSHIQVGAYTTNAYIASGANALDITVSNMTLGAQKKMDPAILLDGLTFNTIKGNNESQNAIYSSLNLPDSVPGPLLIPLTWTSDRPEIIGKDGKVGRVTRDETVTVSAALTSDPSKTKSFTLTVKGPETAQPSPNRADAGFANPTVAVDGVLNEDGWRMGGRILDQKSMIAAEYGFQWNQTHLFAAVDFAHEVGGLTLTLNGHTFTVENGKLLENGGEVAGAKLAVGDGIVELSLPLSAIGMGSKISTYGKSMPMAIKADGIAGPATTLTLTDVDWFAADGRNYKTPGSSFGSQIKVTGNAPVEGYQGATRLENGWHLYDLYNPNGSNPAGVRTWLMYSNPGFDDRTAGTRVEFDFYAKSMPLGVWDDPHVGIGSHANYGFAFVFGTKADANKESWAVPCGIVNTEEGLVFVMHNEVAHKVNLDKRVGDAFTVAAEWNRDNTLDVYVDGMHKGTLAAASMWKLGAANQSVVFNMHRNPQLPGAASPADSYDFTISNIAFGHTYDEDGVLGALSFADIAGSNTSPDRITGNLIMTDTITDGLLDNTYPITWTSSDERVVSRSGVVTRPENGAAFATVTATADGQSKSFDVVVLGETMDNSWVRHKENDLNPAVGAGIGSEELLFTFDTNNNSIIAVKEQSEKINLVTLTDGDDKARLNAESLTLWVSEDNKTYTQVEDFKLVHIERNWYLYDFEAQGKYIKVHYTHYRGGEADFVGAYGQMITAGYDKSLVKGKATEYTVTNDTTVKYDPTLVIPGLSGDLSRVRVFDKTGKLLYHYVEGDTLVVRYPELALGASAKVYVQYASSSAIELASKENVYEVTYGKREIYVNATSNRYHRWVLSLPAGTKFANGSTLKQDTLYSMGGELYTSTDGGRTLTLHSKVIDTAPFLKTPVERMGGSGGWIFDSRTGRMFFHFYYIYNRFNTIDMTQSHCEIMVAASDDGGRSWYLMKTPPRDMVNDPQASYMLTYSDGIELSGNDGKGPNVDFVFPVGAQLNNMGGFCARVFYSKDGGESWHLSESLVTYQDIANHKEGGCSETYIQEREDGVLVLYTRCQGTEIDNFGVSYSLDKGVTWVEECVLSKMYTTNTQPMIRDMEVNGKIADLSIWGGNNVTGGLSYTRNPLNVAVSTNDSETYRNIQNLFFETEMENYDYFDSLFTNHSLAKVNGDDLYLTVYNQPQTQYLNMHVQDFDKWLTRTRGGYDNFEHGTVRFEGWVTVAGGTELSTANARDKYSMQIVKDSVITRSVPYLQNGTVSMEVYVPANGSFTLELQSAFSLTYADVAMPIGLRAQNGKLYMNNSAKAIANLNTGWNTLTFDLELLKDAATLSVNGGEPVALDVLTEAGDYVCYITFGTKSDIWVDEVLVTGELEPVMESTAADKAAANKVIEQIKALESVAADQREAKAKEVLSAYNALTQPQQDLIDRNVVGDPKAEFPMVNYYAVLMSYIPTTAPLTFADVQKGDWYYDAVAYATANGIMSGYNAETFGPNDTLTRAMVVQVLYNKEGQPALNGLKHNFSDVPADQWFNNAVTWGSDRKVVSGFGGGVFKPNDAVTIEQVAVILRNYSGSPNGNGDLSKVGNHSAWAADALKWAVEQGILNNVPFTNATEQATRAQTAQMLTNYLRGN